MGILAISGGSPPFGMPNALPLRLLAGAPAAEGPPPPGSASPRLQPGRAAAPTAPDLFQAARETRQRISAQISHTTLASGPAGNAAFTALQLEFDFFQETRAGELAYFRRRTDAAGDRLEAGQRADFFAAREEISARFSFSIGLSGAALNGFAGAAEGAVDAREVIERLLEIARGLLEKADELFERFFAPLDGGDPAYAARSLDALFSAFASEIQAIFSGERGLPFAGGAVAGVRQLEFRFEFSASVTVTQATVQQGDPIVLDLDGDGIELTTYQQGARFDLIGSGRAQQVAFVHGGDAFLALDRNGDGVINSGLELFGEQHGARNGFEELRRFDDNGDGVIDRRDAVFDSLLLFRDNGNGVTEPGELLSLAEAGIVSISLDYAEVDKRAAGGNRIAQIASFARADGSRGVAADALLNYIV